MRNVLIGAMASAPVWFLVGWLIEQPWVQRNWIGLLVVLASVAVIVWDVVADWEWWRGQKCAGVSVDDLANDIRSLTKSH